MRKRGNAKSKGRSPALNEEDHCLKARTTRKIDLAKPQQADCHLFGARVNKQNLISGLQVLWNTGELRGLPEEMENLDQLCVLLLRDTNFSRIPSVVERLPNLQWLHIRNNQQPLRHIVFD